MPRRRARLVLVAAWAAGLSLVPAAPAAAATTLTVDPGYRQQFAPGRSYPVRVEVRADRLVAGSVTVTSDLGDGRQSVVSMPVEVPGGSAKTFLLVAPALQSFDASPPGVRARLLDRGGREVARSAEVSLRSAPDEELVGLMPGVLGGRPVPGPAALAVDAGVARFVAVGASELARAPFALAPLGTLGAGADELGQLGPVARDGVLRWVAAGGRLLVDAPAGARVEGLPDAWQPPAGGRAPAGRGEVVATDGAMAAGRWAGLVEPTWPSSEAGAGFDDEAVGNTLADDAGLRVPDLGWLMGFLFLYVVVVGPGTAIVLRRRRRPELAWVVIPLVAVLFTTVAWVGGRSLRTGTRLAHATMVELTDAGAWSTTFVGVAARGAQTPEVSFGDRALARSHSGSFDGRAAEITSTGSTARLPLDAGQFGVARGDGPVDLGGLEVTALSEADGRARGTVRNGLPFDLDHVVVLVDGGGTRIGRLAAGEEREWSVAAGADALLRSGGQPELELWSGGRGMADEEVSFALWQTGGVANDPDSRGPGAALVAGWTRDFVPSVTVDGRGRSPVGPTVVVARAPVRPAADLLTDLTISRTVVRGLLSGPFGKQRAFARGRADATTVARFTLPAGVAARPLTARGPVGGLQAWVDGSWTDLRPTGAVVDAPVARGGRFAVPMPMPTVGPVPGPPGVVPPAIAGPELGQIGAAQDYAVPVAAVVSGRVFLRVPDGFDLGASAGSITLREART